MLFKYDEKTYGVVYTSEDIKQGDEFVTGSTDTGYFKISAIDKVLETRKERGVYINENKRKMWAKVLATFQRTSKGRI